MNQHETDLERRLAEIQIELARVGAAVERPAGNREPVELMESRIWSLTQQFAEILDRWTLSDLRHTRAIGEMETRLKNLEALNARLEHDAEEHLRGLERKIGQEWKALQQVLEEPVRLLQEHAASLRETSVAAAGSALSGLERTEERLAAIQADVSDRMSQLTHEVHSALTELRGTPRAGHPGGGVASWPLDQVMRLHNEMRDAEGQPPAPSDTKVPGTIPLLPESAVPAADTVENEIHDHDGSRRRNWLWIAAAVMVIAVSIISAAYAVRLERQFEAATIKMTEAERQAAATRVIAQREIAATQEEAQRRIAEASDAAARAQVVSEILAAPDLVRYGLTGGETSPTARGQLLWSRSRGLVLSASRVPPAPAGSTYQVWLLSAAGAVSAGLTGPDAQGRVSFATDQIPRVAQPVIGAALTLAPAGGAQTPADTAVLAYRPPQ